MAKNAKFAPALSDNPMEIGERYMVLRHRRIISEKLGIDPKEFPKGIDNQIQLLRMLKAENVEKYNKWFDVVVRGLEPEPDVIIALPPELKDEVHRIINDGQQSIMNQAQSEENRLSEYSDNIMENATKFIMEKIEEEAKIVNKIVHEYHIKKPDGKKKILKDVILPEEFQTIIDLATQRLNILLVGPSGCGKSHIAKVVSESLGLDFAAQSCSAGMSESAFAGWLLPVGTSGNFSYVSSEFVRIYENGGVFLIDEIDAADSNMMLFLNGALANGEFYLPQRHKKPKVVKHDDFVCIAAANTFGNGATALYSGRNLMDGATMDRFRCGIAPMNYSPTVEETLSDPIVLEWGRIVRKIIGVKSLRKVMSTRMLKDATKMRAIGWKINKIANSYFSDWSPEEMRMVNNDFEYSNFISANKNEFIFGDMS